jgi:hypothetical protein
MPPTPNILIGTPAYAGMVHIDYLSAISDYFRSGLRFTVTTIGNESLITRARNTILSKFHADHRYTHLFFQDGDVNFSARGLLQLLDHNVDVIGAAVPLKGFNDYGERIFNVGPCLGEFGRLQEVERIGTAALLLSRRSVAALVADASRDGRTYVGAPSKAGLVKNTCYDVFQVGVSGDEYLSEDFWVCRRLRQLGFAVYFDPELVTRHQGVTQF